jgi:hypothetical protein
LFKRLFPFLFVGLGWLAYYHWDQTESASRAAEEERLALVTAQVWIATALYRDEPEKYMAYRDSLLAANDVEREKVFSFLENRRDKTEDLLPFAQRVKTLTDSLGHIQDSLLREERIRLADSVRTADALSSDPTD